MKLVTVRDAEPEMIDSPIQPLIKEFINAPYTWLPECRANLLDLHRIHNFRIAINEVDQRFRFSAKYETCTVTVGLTALERVWGYCFGIPKLYNVLRWEGAGKEIDATQYPELLPARAVLAEVYKSEEKTAPIRWDNLPSPRTAPADEDVLIAYPMFISVTSFLLLHEFAHIVLKHKTEGYIAPEVKYQQEFEADMWAMNFTTGHLAEHNQSDEHFIARANGIVLGLCILSSVELQHQHSGQRVHPGIPERLLRFFDRFIPDHEGEEAHIREVPKYFAATILNAFLLQKKIEVNVAKAHANLFDPIIAVREHFPR